MSWWGNNEEEGEERRASQRPKALTKNYIRVQHIPDILLSAEIS